MIISKKQWQISKRWLGRILGISLVVLMLWQISRQEHLDQWWSNFLLGIRNPEKLRYLLFAIALMPLNWLLEVAKWRQLLHSSWDIDWWSAWRLVLAGISVSIATPNRIGEYGGRLLLAPPEQAAHVVLSSVVGSLCQWVAFLGCGWPALAYWWGREGGWSQEAIFAIAWSMPALLLLGLSLAPLLWRRLASVKLVIHHKWWRWLRWQSRSLRQLERSQLLVALLLALLRFWLYTFQYLLLLWFFNVNLELWVGLSGIFSIYLIQAGIPLPPGLGVISRSEIALLIWGAYTVEPLAIVGATFSVYLINLMLPAFAGTILLLRIKQKTPHENEKQTI